MLNKEKNFVSAVIYVHNAEKRRETESIRSSKERRNTMYPLMRIWSFVTADRRTDAQKRRSSGRCK